jgi:hypothetical protein
MNIEELKVGDKFIQRNGHICTVLHFGLVKNNPFYRWVSYVDITTGQKSTALPYHINGTLRFANELDIVELKPDRFRAIAEFFGITYESKIPQFPNQKSCSNHE